MLLHRLVFSNMVEKAFVAPSLGREVGTSLRIEIDLDLVNTPQIVVKTGERGEDVINGPSRPRRGNRMTGNDLRGGVRPLEPGNETSERVERDLSEISITLIEILEKEHQADSVGAERIERIAALIQVFEVLHQRNDEFPLVVEYNIADTMIGGKNFS